MRRTAAALFALGLAVSMTGCRGGSSGADESPSPSATRSARTEPTVKAAPLPTPPTMKGEVDGIVKDVKITECPTAAGTQVARGTAKNSAKKTRDLIVIVVWLKNNSGDPLGSGMKVLSNVKPGKTVEWNVKAKVVEQADRCALNATAGQAKG